MMDWSGTWLPADICRDLDGDCGCGCGCKQNEHHHEHRERLDRDDRTGGEDNCGCSEGAPDPQEHHRHFMERRRRRAIWIGNVSVDCTPVTFRTPGQAVNIVS
jgi:hypothetical protein